MLSIANVKSSSAAASYYELDDYYAKDSEEHKELSSWHGKGAKELGLKGAVEPEAFKAILEGKLPNGTFLGRVEGGELIHAPGIDMTFSAPKSVSIMAEVGGDNRIYKAHTDAVKTALDWVEKNAVGTRVIKSGRIEVEKADNITAALFRHDTSRNMDPQLHTHCVVANAVSRGDDQWRSAFLGKIFENKMFIGQLYRTELAKSMSGLGYHITPTHNDGRFELQEVPQQVIDAFSSRSKDIRAALEGFEYVNAKTASSAAIGTRSSKQEMDREILREKWNGISEKYGFKVKEVAEKVGEGTYKLPEEPKIDQRKLSLAERHWNNFLKLIGRSTDDDKVIHHGNDNQEYKGSISERSVRYAIDHLSERSSVFDEQSIQEKAMSYGLGSIDLNQVNRAIEKILATGELLKGKEINENQYYTTKDALEREKKIIDYMKAGKGSVTPILSKSELEQLASSIAAETKDVLNTSQRIAAEHLLTSKDRVIGIQGYAGVGKTFMLKVVRQMAEAKNYELIGMAPSASAADTLEKDSGIKSQTIHKFLFKYDGVIHDRATNQGLLSMREEFKNKALVLDESSLASTKQVQGLLKIASCLNTRVILIGDQKQLGAVEAGKPFAQLQEHKMSIVTMDDIFRQKRAELKEAVLHSIKGNIYQALSKLGDNVISVEDVEEKAADLWLQSKDRDKTMVLAPSNNSRTQINTHIRKALKLEGRVDASNEVSHEQWKQKGLTNTENTYAQNYTAGNIVIFNRAYKTLDIQRGDSLKVHRIDGDTGEVRLINAKGKELCWNPSVLGKSHGAVEVFEKESIKLAAGDRVVWKRNDREKDIINSHTASVKEIKGNKITFTMQNGKERVFDKNDPAIRHVDYAYAVTAHSAQGKTTDTVIAVAKSTDKFLTTQQTFYVEISRARHEAVFVVDDKGKVADMLSKTTGEKISALENQGIYYQGESPFDTVQRELDVFEEQLKKEEELERNEPTSENKELSLKIEKSDSQDSLDKFVSSLDEKIIEASREKLAELQRNSLGKDLGLFNSEIANKAVNTNADILDKEPKFTTEEIAETRARLNEMLEKAEEVSKASDEKSITENNTGSPSKDDLDINQL